MVRVQPVRATLPRRRAVRARMGVLEDVRGAAGGDSARRNAMTQLGNGLDNARHHEDELSVREAELAMSGALAHQKNNMLIVQGNLANSHQAWTDREGSTCFARCILWDV